jgi:hypothetical protein
VFPKTEIERFLRAVDQALATRVDLIVIGGSAAALQYGALRATHDIDTLTHASSELDAAAAKARSLTGLSLPIQRVTIADEPEGFASRLVRVLPRLRRLRVFVPERHDLVLMKSTRAYEHDVQVIREIHQNSPVDLETLVDRFVNEMAPIGHPVRIRRNFLTVIEALFPDRVDEVEARLRGR